MTLKPINATSQPVIVVPTLLPKITQTACDNVNKPALAKPRVATVTALEDWTSAVIKKPVARPRRGVLVEEFRISQEESQAA